MEILLVGLEALRRLAQKAAKVWREDIWDGRT